MYSAKSTLCGRALYKSVIYYYYVIHNSPHSLITIQGPVQGRIHDFPAGGGERGLKLL